MTKNVNSNANQEHPIKLDNLALQTIKLGRRNVHEAVVMSYLTHLVRNMEKVKVTVVSPHFCDQFKDVLDRKSKKLEAKKNSKF